MDDQGDPTTPPQRPARAHVRFQVVGEATLRREGSNNYRVRIFDISESGCKIEIIERPRVGDRVWVKFNGLDGLHATVSWVAPPMAGLLFDRQIYPAVFEALMARFAGGGGSS